MQLGTACYTFYGEKGIGYGQCKQSVFCGARGNESS